MSHESLDRAIRKENLRRQISEARWAIGSELLAIMRAGEKTVRLDDPRIGPKLRGLEEMENSLSILEREVGQ